MPTLTDEAKSEIRQFLKSERTEDAEVREIKNTKRTRSHTHKWDSQVGRSVIHSF